MKPVRYLVDTSAFIRLVRNPELRKAWAEPVYHGVLGICPLTELEIFRCARSREERDEWERTLRASYCWVLVPDQGFERAAEVQRSLTDLGAHRSAGPVDLLIAATAEQHRMTILHFDRDFTQVARVTGQPTRWIAAPGSVD
ncbi:PIN domain nuclease [Actinoplanes sp. NPDC051861]|uniref:PIN domain nuclease n=1 Tax=Actinoplanes sp. NPDC051861 TaxID=3155170 RepID=UPI00341C0D83